MGDTFEVVVDVDASADQASALGTAGLRWLIEQSIVEEYPSVGCVVGAENGHRPGSNYAVAVVSVDDHLGRWVTNGVAISTERRVYYPVQGEPGPVICPRCQYAVVLFDPVTGQDAAGWDLFNEGLAEWHDGGAGEVRCPKCGSAMAINEWQWVGEWPISVGHLGFTFWNWPPLNPTFVDRVAHLLGHRVVVTRGKV